jgi:hypothetical protein
MNWRRLISNEGFAHLPPTRADFERWKLACSSKAIYGPPRPWVISALAKTPAVSDVIAGHVDLYCTTAAGEQLKARLELDNGTSH